MIMGCMIMGCMQAGFRRRNRSWSRSISSLRFASRSVTGSIPFGMRSSRSWAANSKVEVSWSQTEAQALDAVSAGLQA